MKNERTMFGKNFKYVLVLTALAYIVYTLPMVRAAMGEINQYQPSTTIVSTDQVSIVSEGSQVAAALDSVFSMLPPQPASCPKGYICVPATMIATWCPPSYQCMKRGLATSTPMVPTIPTISTSTTRILH